MCLKYVLRLWGSNERFCSMYGWGHCRNTLQNVVKPPVCSIRTFTVLGESWYSLESFCKASLIIWGIGNLN